MGFTYDQVEDIRLAVGEACTNAIDRAARNGSHSTDNFINILCHVEAAKLTIEVEDHTGKGAAASDADIEAPAGDIEGMNPQELGALLMEILVDEVNMEALPDGGGTRVRLVKYTAEAAQ